MIDALRYEGIRIRTLRSTYWLVGLGVAISAGIALILAIVTRNDDRGAGIEIGFALGGPPSGNGTFLTFIPIFMAIMGILAAGHEYRYGTIQPTLTAIPQRSRLLAAKIVIVALVAVFAVLVSLAINLAIGAIVWGGLPDLAADPHNQVLPGYFVMVLLYATLGIALAQLFRGVPSAIVVLLVTPMVVEQIIIGLTFIPALDWLAPAIKFLPFAAASRLIEISRPDFGPEAPDYGIFERWPSGGVFAAFVLIILAVAWYLFQTRDA